MQMKRIDSLEEETDLSGYHLTIGFFDGFHLGHMELIQNAKSKGKCALLTFSTNLKSDIRNHSSLLLLSEEEKRRKAEEIGIDFYLELSFKKRTKETTSEDFLSFLRRMHPESITVGTDFTFGKGASGKSEDLLSLKKEGIEIDILPLMELGGEKVSTTRIKKLLSGKEIPEANQLLGYPFYYEGKVIHGKENGRKISFPTCNLEIPAGKFLLPEGVYRTETIIDDRTYQSMTNIGNHPTIDALRKDIIETNVFSFEKDIYGEEIKVNFLSFLRDQKTFASMEELKNQLEKDKIQASRQEKTE